MRKFPRMMKTAFLVSVLLGLSSIQVSCVTTTPRYSEESKQNIAAADRLYAATGAIVYTRPYLPLHPETQSTGSGTFFRVPTDNSLRFLTCAHCVSDDAFSQTPGKGTIRVFRFNRNNDHEIYESEMIGTIEYFDRQTDYAIIRINDDTRTNSKHPIPTITFTRQAKLGSTFYYFGNPHLLFGSYVRGMVSHVSRKTDARDNRYQLQVYGGPGSSGAGVFNEAYECFGVIATQFDNQVLFAVNIENIQNSLKEKNSPYLLPE